MQVIRPMGTHLQIGLFGKNVPFRLDSLFDREVTYVATNSTATSSWKITIDLLTQKKVELAPFLSLKAPLQDWRSTFDAVVRKKVYKAVLLPNNDFGEN